MMCVLVQMPYWTFEWILNMPSYGRTSENYASSITERREGLLMATAMVAVGLVVGVVMVYVSGDNDDSFMIGLVLIVLSLPSCGLLLCNILRRKIMVIRFYKMGVLLRTHHVSKRIPYDQIIRVTDSVDHGPIIILKKGNEVLLDEADFRMDGGVTKERFITILDERARASRHGSSGSAWT